jgi:hypothetical protein
MTDDGFGFWYNEESTMNFWDHLIYHTVSGYYRDKRRLVREHEREQQRKPGLKAMRLKPRQECRLKLCSNRALRARISKKHGWRGNA